MISRGLGCTYNSLEYFTINALHLVVAGLRETSRRILFQSRRWEAGPYGSSAISFWQTVRWNNGQQHVGLDLHTNSLENLSDRFQQIQT
jgi:hypothetical protein